MDLSTIFTDAAQARAGTQVFLEGIAGAEGMLGSGAGTGTGSIQDFMSPFQQQVIDTTLGEFDRQRQIQEQAIRDQQAQLGVLGAGRAGVQFQSLVVICKRKSFITSRITTTRFPRCCCKKTTRFSKQTRFSTKIRYYKQN